MSTGRCRNCGAATYYEGGGRPRTLCDACRGGRYGAKHQKKRKAELESAYGKPCARCGKPMLEGQELHLDHRDGGGPDEYLGFSHKSCNLAAASRQRDLRAAARVAAEPVPKRREPPPCKFHDPPRPDCPHSRDW